MLICNISESLLKGVTTGSGTPVYPWASSLTISYRSTKHSNSVHNFLLAFRSTDSMYLGLKLDFDMTDNRKLHFVEDVKWSYS